MCGVGTPKTVMNEYFLGTFVSFANGVFPQ